MNKFKKLFFIAIVISILAGCNEFSGKIYYASDDSTKYIKFLNSNTLEWSDHSGGAGIEEFDYTIEDNKIRTVRKLDGLGQIEYIDILNSSELRPNNESIYTEQK